MQHYFVDWYHAAWIGGYRTGEIWQWMGRVTENITYYFMDSRDKYSDAGYVIVWGRGWKFGEFWCGETRDISHYCEAESMV